MPLNTLCSKSFIVRNCTYCVTFEWEKVSRFQDVKMSPFFSPKIRNYSMSFWSSSIKKRHLESDAIYFATVKYLLTQTLACSGKMEKMPIDLTLEQRFLRWKWLNFCLNGHELSNLAPNFFPSEKYTLCFHQSTCLRLSLTR